MRLPGRSNDDGQPDPEVVRERRRDEQDEQTARQLAQRGASDASVAAPGYWDMLGDPDIDTEEWGGELEPFVKGELSRAFALGNITRDEYRNLQLRIENEFWQVQNEMRGPASKLGDDDMRMMYGEERADLNDNAARRLRSAREVKKNLTSLSVDGRGIRSGTEIHAVARTEDGNPDDEDSGGLFASVGNYLSG